MHLKHELALKMYGEDSTNICVKMEGKSEKLYRYLETLLKYSKEVFVLCYFPPLQIPC